MAKALCAALLSMIAALGLTRQAAAVGTQASGAQATPSHAKAAEWEFAFQRCAFLGCRVASAWHLASSRTRSGSVPPPELG